MVILVFCEGSKECKKNKTGFFIMNFFNLVNFHIRFSLGFYIKHLCLRCKVQDGQFFKYFHVFKWLSYLRFAQTMKVNFENCEYIVSVSYQVNLVKPFKNRFDSYLVPPPHLLSVDKRLSQGFFLN